VATSQGTTLKVNRAIGGGETIGANCYAVVTYKSEFIDPSHQYQSWLLTLTRTYGPGQVVPGSFSSQKISRINNTLASTLKFDIATFTLAGGVEFING
jgi:hypothetical protein